MNLHRNSPLPPPWTSRCTDTHNKNSKQNENLHPIWERESEHPQSHCHQIATHISSNLPKINEPKPTSNLRERIRVREREDWNEREREPPIATAPNHHVVAADLQTTTMLPLIFSPCYRFQSPVHTDLRETPNQKEGREKGRWEMRERSDRVIERIERKKWYFNWIHVIEFVLLGLIFWVCILVFLCF